MTHQAPHMRHSKNGKPFHAGRGNPKNMSYQQLKKKINIAPLDDYDGDGVPNYRDCKPLDKKRQDKMSREQFAAEYDKDPDGFIRLLAAQIVVADGDDMVIEALNQKYDERELIDILVEDYNTPVKVGTSKTDLLGMIIKKMNYDDKVNLMQQHMRESWSKEELVEMAWVSSDY